MKQIGLLAVILLSLSTLLATSVAAQSQGEKHAPSHAAGGEKHGFGVKEYEAFHDILHPLEHEALPNKDFKTIRAKAGELVTAGDAIVKVGVPAGVKDGAGFKKGLKTFRNSLAKYKADAREGTDDQLKVSYSAVHDSFEMLASMLPRK